MSAPEKIWAVVVPAGIGGWTEIKAGSREGYDFNGYKGVEYTRTDLTPPAADYVAGLEAAMSVYRDNLWREIMGGEGCLGHPCCVSPKGEGCDCQDKFARIEKYAGYQSLADRPDQPDEYEYPELMAALDAATEPHRLVMAPQPASPDTRVVPTALLRQLNKLSGYVHENEIHAIIDGEPGK